MECDAFLAEAAPGARLYGAIDAPISQTAPTDLFARMNARLVPSPIIGEFLDIMERVPALPGPMRPLQRLLVWAAVDMLPAALVRGWGWRGGHYRGGSARWCARPARRRTALC